MNKILPKTFTVITVFLAISTPRNSAQQYCKSPLFDSVDSIINQQNTCMECHGASRPANAPDFRPLVDPNTTNREQLWVNPPPQSTPHSTSTYVVPGDDANSLLSQKVNAGMGNLSTTDKGTIANWIDSLKRMVTVLVAQPPNDGGTVTPNGTFTIAIGTPLILTASPITDWTFKQWTDSNNMTYTGNQLFPNVPWCDIIYTAFFNQLAAVSITKAADDASVSSGSQIGFTVTLNNSSATTATGLSVTDILPAGTDVNWTLDSSNPPDAWSVVDSPQDQRLVYSFTTLSGNTGTTAHVVSSTTNMSCSTYTNTASFSTDNGGSDQASASETVLCPTPTPTAVLSNISSRTFVQTGDNVMIGGFIVQGTAPKRVIIRAIGPELGLPPYNIANALANPTLELHDGTGAVIATNDNWQTTIIGGVITGNQVSDIQNSGHAPTEANESAIIANLAPGNYTAIVRGVNNTTGVALVEVYDLQ